MWRVLATALVAAGAAHAAAADFQLRKLMLTGETAPGIEPALVDEIGTYVDVFNTSPFQGRPSIGSGGSIGIVAVHDGDGDPRTRDGQSAGVWRAVGGVLLSVANKGDVAPGTGGDRFLGFPAFSAATPEDHGDGVAFLASVPGPAGSERQGIWSDRGGALHKLLLVGEPLPGMPAGASAFQFAFVSRGPAVLVESNWSCPEGCFLADEGLWRDVDGALQPVVRRRDPVPGFGRDAIFDDFSNASARTGPIHFWNGGPTGRFIFNGYATGPRIDSSNNEGFFVEGSAGLTLLAREGERVPGKSGFRWGARSGFQSFGDFTVMGTPILTGNGRALFGASIHNGRFNRFGGLFTTRTGAIVQLVQTVFRIGSDSPPQSLATPAPGFPAGHFFRQVFAGRMNAQGEIYFDADVVDEADPSTPKAAIFRIRAGSSAIELHAAVGGPAPSLPGLTLAEARIGRLFETGHYLWIGRLQGEGVDGSNDLAAFLTDPAGATDLVFRSGDTIDVQGDGSDFRVLADFTHDASPQTGFPRVEQVFEMRFADGSAGVFVGRLVSP